MGNTAGKGFATLTKADIERLQRRFKRQSGNKDYIYLSQLESMKELAGNPFLPRIFQLFDTRGGGILTMEDFVKGVEYLATLNNQDEQFRFAFRIFDLDGDGYVTQSEMFQMLQKLQGKNTSDTQLEQIVSCLMVEYDQDGDNRLSPQEFRSVLSSKEIQHKMVIPV